jgi:hypothetical protein
MSHAVLLLLRADSMFRQYLVLCAQALEQKAKFTFLPSAPVELIAAKRPKPTM